MQKFWNAIGLPRSKEMPAALGWVEILAGFYLAFTFFAVLLPVLSQIENPRAGVIAGFIGGSIVMLGLMGLAVLLTTRRGGRIAYWIAIALLLRPIAMTLQKIINAPENAAALISVPNALILASTMTAAILLLLPSSKAWVEKRRAELKR